MMNVVKTGCEHPLNADLCSAPGLLRPGTGALHLQGGYLIIEALVYIGALLVLLGVGLIALHRCVDNSVVLRRNADDIAQAMHMGERWRSDVRAATNAAWVQQGGGDILQLAAGPRSVEYRFVDGAVYRRAGGGSWSRILERVKLSTMRPETRLRVTCWHWDLELQPRARGATPAPRMRPLFTFIAVPHTVPRQ